MGKKFTPATGATPSIDLTGLRADKEMAAHYMVQNFPRVLDTWNIADIQLYLRKKSTFESTNYVYVVDAHEKLVGVISLHKVFAHPDLSIRRLMKKEIITVSPDTHIERVAKLAVEYNLRAIPVVKRGALLGVIETQKILSILNRALHEHLLTFGGVHKSHLDYDDTMKVPVPLSIKHRLPWLLIGLFGVIVAAAIIDQFEAVLNRHLILAFFIPAIVYMSDALGTQNQTMLIRDLAVMGRELKINAYVLRTTIIACIMSIIIGVLVFGVTSILWHETQTAYVIAIAMFVTLMVSSTTSLATTLIFRHFKQDPALGSGPFATIVSDLSAIVIYFIIVALLL